MSDTLDQISQKVDQLLQVVKNLKTENATLQGENKQLKAQVADLSKDHKSLSLQAADQSEAVRSKLQLVLSRLDELEELAGP
ncbi:MAG: cell division protein ZapB [candidate division Zixibacteria bacterium]|nr:cell division protein ZapB [candidate division Zixibacteria bacterium]MDH3938319.1 cell division protein ZapB [candidate division Zixibacteria bacterium]MDH4034029.1 cell division protein ZapB [candidate division Zixibacteria bacterium]